MTKLVWNSSTKKYHTGLSRGVIYPAAGGVAVWNGLLNAIERRVGAATESVYFDGVKSVEYPLNSDFQIDLTAISCPLELRMATGYAQVREGVYLLNQIRGYFHLSYRTELGSNGYLLHLIYNATAVPTKRDTVTMSNSPTASELSWKLTVPPTQFAGYRPAGHFFVDSTRVPPAKLTALENALYGVDGGANGALVPITQVVALLT